MICLFNTPAHDGADILPVRLSIRRDVQLMCSGCRAHVSASTYLRVVDRRMTDLPVITERRRLPRPKWLAKALDWSVA